MLIFQQRVGNTLCTGPISAAAAPSRPCRQLAGAVFPLKARVADAQVLLWSLRCVRHYRLSPAWPM